MTKSVFQQALASKDCWGAAFSTPRRGQEQPTAAQMVLATTPAFFQHRMESLFGQYLWKFVLVYIDDITSHNILRSDGILEKFAT
jgi:hypothetical protein